MRGTILTKKQNDPKFDGNNSGTIEENWGLRATAVSKRKLNRRLIEEDKAEGRSRGVNRGITPVEEPPARSFPQEY